MNSDSRDSILCRLTALDFLAVDLQLFLNTHADNKEVIKKYNKVIEEADALRYIYEEKYGPLCSFRSRSQEEFTWINNPWPWSEKFNFYIKED